MAAISGAYSAILLYMMEYHQPDTFLQRANASGIINSALLDTSASQLNQTSSIPIASTSNSNGSCFNMYSPVPGGQSAGVFLGNTLPMQNAERTSVTCSVPSSRMRKKHRRDHEDFDCPSKRRKLRTSPVFEGSQVPTTYSGDAPVPCWNTSHSQVTPAAAGPSLCIPSTEMQTVLTEGMDESVPESHSDAALRRIRDIESRLIIEDDDDDDDEEEPKNDRLPTLVISDLLAESLKKGLDESLTKKIVDSMNRPSMELVLWKPQPELLIDKLQSFSRSHKEEAEASKQTPPKIPFLQHSEVLETDHEHLLDCDDIDPVWGREEEEMEL